MGATIPAGIADTSLSKTLEQSLVLLHRGKVRDTYSLKSHPDKLLVVATDRISIFDFVLNALVPQKGEVLTALTVFWLTGVLSDYPNHLVAHGSDIDWYLPVGCDPVLEELRRRALIVQKQEMLPIECIARGYLVGSAWDAYKENGKVCDVRLPTALFNGDKLDRAIFTPTTKAEHGHDEPIAAWWVKKHYGSWVGGATRRLFESARDYALSRGIIIVDTKFEFGVNRILADEVLTPDSSRFWDTAEYDSARRNGMVPSGYDKQPVRDAGKVALIDGKVWNIGKLDPNNPEHAALVESWVVPSKVIEQTTRRYVEILKRLTGIDLR